MATALTGNETLQVLGQNPTGVPAAGTFQTTTGAIASLAALDTTTEAFTALNTVGNGTITAAGIVGKNTNRGGAQSGTPFTDTTDTAANILALLPSGAPLNTSFKYVYVNNTNAVATITGGTGVTVSGVTTVQANSWATYIITYTAAATLTMVGITYGNFISLGTFVAAGTASVGISNSALTVGSDIGITLKTVGGTVGAVPSIKTIAPGVGFTVSGTAGDTSTYNFDIVG